MWNVDVCLCVCMWMYVVHVCMCVYVCSWTQERDAIQGQMSLERDG